MKKNIFYILIIIMLIGLFSPTVRVVAQQTTTPATQTQADVLGTCTMPDKTIRTNWTAKSCSDNKGSWVGPYVLLAPLPCDATTTPGCSDGKLITFDTTSDTSGKSKIGEYLNMMIKIFIGICAVLAVIMIVIGGIEYMTSELISNKEEGKERITHAILGLLLALGAWTILYQINPKLLDTNLTSLAPVTVALDLGGFSSTPSAPIQKDALQKLGITDCTGSGGKSSVVTIAQEFKGKTNYSMTNRNTISGSTINLDCTSFIDQVYNCAGLSMPEITSANIASLAKSTTGGQPVNSNTFDFNTLHPGDLVGWEGNASEIGHVAIYIGNGQIIDTNGSGNTQVLPLDTYKKSITFVRWP